MYTFMSRSLLNLLYHVYGSNRPAVISDSSLPGKIQIMQYAVHNATWNVPSDTDMSLLPLCSCCSLPRYDRERGHLCSLDGRKIHK